MKRWQRKLWHSSKCSLGWTSALATSPTQLSCLLGTFLTLSVGLTFTNSLHLTEIYFVAWWYTTNTLGNPKATVLSNSPRRGKLFQQSLHWQRNGSSKGSSELIFRPWRWLTILMSTHELCLWTVYLRLSPLIQPYFSISQPLAWSSSAKWATRWVKFWDAHIVQAEGLLLVH